MSRTIACPRCGKSSVYDPANKWRPFCSERCKMIDLGAWAAEDYRVPAEDIRDAESDPESPEKP